MDALSRHYPDDVVHEVMLRAGSDRPVQQTLTRKTFVHGSRRDSGDDPGSDHLFLCGFCAARSGRIRKAIPLQNPEAIVAVKLTLLALVIYKLIFHLANVITIDGVNWS